MVSVKRYRAMAINAGARLGNDLECNQILLYGNSQQDTNQHG